MLARRHAVAVTLIALLLAACGQEAKKEPAEARTEPAKPALTKVTFVTDWKAQAEHGGFYQALATGLYEKAGLEVTIKQGGPAVNTPQLIAAGAVDFAMASNSFQPLNVVAAGGDAVAVAAIFQKDPQVLIAHPRKDVNSIADMKGKPIMVSDATKSTWWIWAKATFKFEDKQIRPYAFNLAPFLTDAKAIQQGYVTSEPYTIETEGKVKPQVFLLADYGYPGYSNMIMARGKDVRERPQIVQAFVDATIDGWESYLNGDPSLANALIKKENPEMTDAIIAQAIAQMRERGMVQGGDASTQGIGSMTDARWKTFTDMMREAKVYDDKFDATKAYTLAFVNKGRGALPRVQEPEKAPAPKPN